MGLLERWDERNQAWADRQRAKPYPPPPGRLAGGFQIAMAIYVVVRLVAALATGAWLTVILFGPLVAMFVWAFLRARWQRSAT